MTTYTVVGIWIEDTPVVAAVIPGCHPAVDDGPDETDIELGEYQRWATVVESASNPQEAEEQAVQTMLAYPDSAHLEVL